jgi:hypothetical protein
MGLTGLSYALYDDNLVDEPDVQGRIERNAGTSMPPDGVVRR